MFSRELLLAIVLIVSIGNAAMSADVTVGDSAPYLRGSYTGDVNPFGGGSELRPNRMAVVSALFPNKTTITWDYQISSCAGVCGFLSVWYGSYWWNVPKMPTPVIKVNDMVTALESHDLHWCGALDGFDVIADWFLYTTSDQVAMAVEFEVFLHTNSAAAAFVSDVKQIGRVIISGIDWTVAYYPNAPAGPPDILFMPTNRRDIPRASIDLHAMILYARSQGLITGNEWFTGMAMGVEPKRLGGSMTINAFSVTSQ